MIPKAQNRLSRVVCLLLWAYHPAHAQSSRADYFFIQDSVEISADWKLCQSFGLFSDSQFPWIYHDSLGYVFLGEVGASNGFYMWSPKLESWIWTQKDAFPYAYDFNSESWIWFQMEDSNPWYYNFRQARWSRLDGEPSNEPSTKSPQSGMSLAEVSRFLGMATLGADYETIVRVHALGMNAWLEGQFNIPPTYATQRMLELHPTLIDPPPYVDMGVLYEVLQNLMMTAQDQVRQKVALALSEILVVAIVGNQTETAPAYITYYDLLLKHAFGKYGDLLYDVSLNPVMGHYLSHAGNEKAEPYFERFPDENYARELMQLFSVGLYELNPDGTKMLDNLDQPIPTYGNQEIMEMARVFTGLYYDQREYYNYDMPDFYKMLKDESRYRTAYRNLTSPMLMFRSRNDSGTRTLLNGYTLHSGINGLDAIRATVNHLVQHPNTAPFVSRLLIQRLVKSNPTPGYVGRVSAVFTDNGNGETGDLKAVVRAILTDPEALDPTTAAHSSGRMRPPYYRIIHLLRAFNASDGSKRYYMDDLHKKDLQQVPFQSPTVFNFYLPDFQPQGEIGDANLVAPEFQITNFRTITKYFNLIEELLFDMQDYYDYFNSPEYDGKKNQNEEEDYYPGHYPEPFKFDFSGLEPLKYNRQALIDRLDILLTHGQLSDNTRDVLNSTLRDNRLEPDDIIPLTIYLIMTSPDYIILH